MLLLQRQLGPCENLEWQPTLSSGKEERVMKAQVEGSWPAQELTQDSSVKWAQVCRLLL